MKDGFQGERQLVLPAMVVRQMEEDRFLSALHITDIGYYPAASYHEIHRKEGGGQYVFIYCVKGCGWYELEGWHYDIQPNQYFMIPVGKPHDYGAKKGDPWTIYWIHFKGTLASCYADHAAEPKDVRPELHSRIANRQNLFEEIFSIMQHGFTMENLSYSSSLFHYYLGSLRYIQQYRAVSASESSLQLSAQNMSDAVSAPLGKQFVSALIHYMEENKEKHLTLEMLSRYSGYSASHMSFLFRQQTGMAPLVYFNKLKMEEACYLLDNTDMKINQICHKLGIDDAYYFSRLFTNIVGMSPRAYRSRTDAQSPNVFHAKDSL